MALVLTEFRVLISSSQFLSVYVRRSVFKVCKECDQWKGRIETAVSKIVVLKLNVKMIIVAKISSTTCSTGGVWIAKRRWNWGLGDERWVPPNSYDRSRLGANTGPLYTNSISVSDLGYLVNVFGEFLMIWKKRAGLLGYPKTFELETWNWIYNKRSGVPSFAKDRVRVRQDGWRL